MKIRILLCRVLYRQAGSVHYIGGSDLLPAPLKGEEEQRALEGLQAGEEAARQKLVEHNLRLVVYIARRFENTGIHLEDLISIGTIGLIKAIGTYRTDRKIRLATYASRCIENEILMHMRKISGQRAEVSLNEPINMDGEGNELQLGDILGTADDMIQSRLDEAVDLSILRRSLTLLSPRERELIAMRYGLEGRKEQTQKEAAAALGISQSYISRLEKKILLRLKKEFIRQTSCA